MRFGFRIAVSVRYAVPRCSLTHKRTQSTILRAEPAGGRTCHCTRARPALLWPSRLLCGGSAAECARESAAFAPGFRMVVRGAFARHSRLSFGPCAQHDELLRATRCVATQRSVVGCNTLATCCAAPPRQAKQSKGRQATTCARTNKHKHKPRAPAGARTDMHGHLHRVRRGRQPRIWRRGLRSAFASMNSRTCTHAQHTGACMRPHGPTGAQTRARACPRTHTCITARNTRGAHHYRTRAGAS